MFIGIIEVLGEVWEIKQEGINVYFIIVSLIFGVLKVDQSVVYNGICFIVVKLDEGIYIVIVIEEILKWINFGDWFVGSLVNLEWVMKVDVCFDGYMVQGYVDVMVVCMEVEIWDGSWYYCFKYQFMEEYLLVDKGFICINGVSFMVVELVGDCFLVVIIFYIYEYINFKDLEVGDCVNLEFDIIGKYIVCYVYLYV